MIRVAFTLIGGKNWTGGHNYLLNLMNAISAYQQNLITAVLFIPADAEIEIEDFFKINGIEIIQTNILNSKNRKFQLISAIFFGRIPSLNKLFIDHKIDVVFEAAQFFGWRLGLPAIAWIPDFQHKLLPHLFTKAAWWKREIGFRAQIFGNRQIMVSSNDAHNSCIKYYPSTKRKIHTVHFAVPSRNKIDLNEAREIANQYDLPWNFIFMPNQFWRHKNHLIVLDSLEILRNRGIEITVVSSGKQSDPRSPEYYSSFEKILKNKNLEKIFKVLGLIPYAHIQALMLSCQAMLNPSLFEGWSTTVEEARALGTPMLLSDIEVHREQMGTGAKYFIRNSAESLAEQLQLTPSFDVVEREFAQALAKENIRARVMTFANEFGDLVVKLAEKKRNED